MLNPYTQSVIHKAFFSTLGFSGKLLSEKELKRRIKSLPFQERKINNLLKFVEALNTISFKEVKAEFKSTYNYLAILKKYEICVYYMDVNAMLEDVMQVRIKRKLHSLNLLKKFLESIRTPLSDSLDNIYILINRFNNLNFNIRI
jgi:hypothetical protein